MNSNTSSSSYSVATKLGLPVPNLTPDAQAAAATEDEDDREESNNDYHVAGDKSMLPSSLLHAHQQATPHSQPQLQSTPGSTDKKRKLLLLPSFDQLGSSSSSAALPSAASAIKSARISNAFPLNSAALAASGGSAAEPIEQASSSTTAALELSGKKKKYAKESWPGRRPAHFVQTG